MQRIDRGIYLSSFEIQPWRIVRGAGVGLMLRFVFSTRVAAGVTIRDGFQFLGALDVRLFLVFLSRAIFAKFLGLAQLPGFIGRQIPLYLRRLHD